MRERIDSAKRFQAVFGVSRETIERLEALTGLLVRWQRTINLLGPREMADIWHRHLADCAQLWPLAPRRVSSWLDLGSGAGFPGLVIAILAREQEPSLCLHLVEADARKAAFLREAARVLDVRASVHPVRIERLALGPAHVISARALAPLGELVGYAHRHRCRDGTALYPKGVNAHKELDAARRLWNFEYRLHPSLTDPRAVIIEVGAIHGPRPTDNPRPRQPEGGGR